MEGFLKQALLVIVLVLALRLPFLNQAIQGDDVYYLKGAEHAQIDPLHPTHARFPFMGKVVDMRGHPHPPLNVFSLAALLAIFHDVHEIPFHAAYIVFSWMAGLSMLSLARRFTDKPLIATALFLVTPAFVVNGNSLESDIPLLAFWMAAIALFLAERYVLAAIAGALASFAAYQAILLTPILGLWLWNRRSRSKLAWASTLAAPAAVAIWQIYERTTSGALPASMLAGYMQSYNLQALAAKLRSAAALTGHLAWIVFPVASLMAFRRVPLWALAVSAGSGAVAAIFDFNPLFWMSFGIGVLIVIWCGTRIKTEFLAAWVILFFAAALVIFFAGSARYLLPIAAPLALLVTRELNQAWWAVIPQGALALLLTMVNYQHWGAYRDFVREVRGHRIFTNAEWGLRYYLESNGGLQALTGQRFLPGDVIVSTDYGSPIEAGPTAAILRREIRSAIPLRIVGLGSKSGYSSAAFGLRPFDVSLAPLDRLRIDVVSERVAKESRLQIGTPEAADQIISGIYNNDRWMGAKGIVLLKRPPEATRIEAMVFLPPQSPARQVSLLVDGNLVVRETYPREGRYTISGPAPAGTAATVTVEVDKTFTVPSDQRELGILLLEIGYR